jgi:hypothetical protein
MYQLKIQLKQHTPIIHFQHDQAGATLRASEVKPKLDRFLIEMLIVQKTSLLVIMNRLKIALYTSLSNSLF